MTTSRVSWKEYFGSLRVSLQEVATGIVLTIADEQERVRRKMIGRFFCFV